MSELTAAIEQWHQADKALQRERAAHEETRRERDQLREECDTLEKAADLESRKLTAAEAALEQARRELVEARAEITEATTGWRIKATEAIRRDALRPLATLLGCEPGEIVEQARNMVAHCREVLDALMDKIGDTDFPPKHPGLWQDACNLFDDLSVSLNSAAPARPASEPAGCTCYKSKETCAVHYGGYAVPAASGAEPAQVAEAADKPCGCPRNGAHNCAIAKWRARANQPGRPAFAGWPGPDCSCPCHYVAQPKPSEGE